MPEAAFFVAAERTSRIEFVVGVRPNHSGAEFVYDLENLAAFIGPDTGAQAVGRVVGARDRFLGRAESHYAQNRAENFLLRDAVGDIVTPVARANRLVPKPFLVNAQA